MTFSNNTRWPATSEPSVRKSASNTKKGLVDGFLKYVSDKRSWPLTYVSARESPLGLVGKMEKPSKNSTDRLEKAVDLDLNNNRWGGGVGVGGRKWSDPTVSDWCCRAECQLSGELCVPHRCWRGATCSHVLRLFPSFNVNLPLVHLLLAVASQFTQL